MGNHEHGMEFIKGLGALRIVMPDPYEIWHVKGIKMISSIIEHNNPLCFSYTLLRNYLFILITFLILLLVFHEPSGTNLNHCRTPCGKSSIKKSLNA